MAGTFQLPPPAAPAPNSPSSWTTTGELRTQLNCCPVPIAQTQARERRQTCFRCHRWGNGPQQVRLSRQPSSSPCPGAWGPLHPCFPYCKPFFMESHRESQLTGEIPGGPTLVQRRAGLRANSHHSRSHQEQGESAKDSGLSGAAHGGSGMSSRAVPVLASHYRMPPHSEQVQWT